MKKIDGSPKSLKQLLLNTKYSIHYYQREYMWQKKHMEELIDDLTSEFLDFYRPDHTRHDVDDYGVYFMGSIVLAGRENAIIDGQQRLSSLTLLLIYLNNRLKAIGEKNTTIEGMIYSESHGTASFNISVEDREECIKALFEGKDFDPTNYGESVKNLYDRYTELLESSLGEVITNDNLQHFCDWLCDKVFFIEIVANTEQDAHKVFVTMNDRGLSLTPTEMLKGYILSEISNDTNRENKNNLWKEKVLMLRKDDDQGDDTFIKAWLRAKYAITIRETKAGAVNQDFDIIGGPFHKWVRDERSKLGLNNSEDYEHFIDEFSKFAEVYTLIKNAENTYTEELKYVFYNAQLNFTLQPMLLLAPIKYEDKLDIIKEKINLTARFIDLYITSRVTRYWSVDYSTIKNAVFNYVKELRNLDVSELKSKLLELNSKLNYNPDEVIPSFGLNNFTKKYIKNIIARITGYIEEQTGVSSNYINYMDTKTRNPFEVEHIITNHYEWFTDEYTDQLDFRRWRNDIGALLLLRKSINSSLSDERYGYKLQKYCSTEGNIFTESLGPAAYINNPQFIKFINNNHLDFKPYETFGKKEIAERNKLISTLIKLVWNDEMFR